MAFKRYILSPTQDGRVVVLLPDRLYQIETTHEYRTKDKYKGWVVKIRKRNGDTG
jgi:hypothetical protein